MINSTNLTLAEQKVSGILGLGFPRLSVLSRALFESEDGQMPPSSTNSSTTVTTSGPPNSTSPSYLPTLLESLVTIPLLTYPVFALALSPPPRNSTSATSTASSAQPSESRYSSQVGSLTLGGVSQLYVSNVTGSGVTVNDIEWHQVIPFGPSLPPARNSTVHIQQSSNISDSTHLKRQTDLNAPMSFQQLDEEAYLFWTIQMHNVSMNGTDVPLSPTYPELGVGSVALLDVGNNGIYGPQQDVERLFADITDARVVADGIWAVPCDTEMAMGFSFG